MKAMMITKTMTTKLALVILSFVYFALPLHAQYGSPQAIMTDPAGNFWPTCSCDM